MIRNSFFVDREWELEFLNKRYREVGLDCIVIYGRRRVGKTALIAEFCRGKPHIYFLSDKRGSNHNAERFAKICAQYFGDFPPIVESFEDVFKYVKNRYEGERFIIVVDEFSYLASKDPSIPSVFQLVLDEVLKGTRVFLILCGSSISMMEEEVLGARSPLYGRRTGQIKVQPMNIFQIARFYPDRSGEDIIGFYGVLGGSPMYHTIVDRRRALLWNIREKLLSKGEILYEEAFFLLREELRDPSTYMSILEAMAQGAAKLTEIANTAGLNAKDLPAYMKPLLDLEFVRRETPITEKKGSLYRIADNFFKFWFKYLYPNLSSLEIGETDKILQEVKSDFDNYIAKFVFEEVAREYLMAENTRGTLPFRFTRIGRWWSKHEEVDLVALDEKDKKNARLRSRMETKKNGYKGLRISYRKDRRHQVENLLRKILLPHKQKRIPRKTRTRKKHNPNIPKGHRKTTNPPTENHQHKHKTIQHQLTTQKKQPKHVHMKTLALI